MSDPFRSFDPDGTRQRLEQVFDFSRSLPLARPGAVRCPVCTRSEPIPRRWGFHESEGSPRPWRCDVSFKCTWCAHVWVHGLAISEEEYAVHGKVRLDRREAEAILREEGWEP